MCGLSPGINKLVLRALRENVGVVLKAQTFSKHPALHCCVLAESFRISSSAIIHFGSFFVNWLSSADLSWKG